MVFQRMPDDLVALRQSLAGKRGQAFWRSLEELARLRLFKR